MPNDQIGSLKTEVFALNTTDRLKSYFEVEEKNPVIEKIIKLAGDASTRQYFRVFYKGSSFIVALYPESFDALTHPFCDVTKLFLIAKLPVPKIVSVSAEYGLMLLEDLGDERLQDWLTNASPIEQKRAYQEAIELILAIQNATSLAIKENSISSQLAFDEAKLGWELDFFYKHYFHSYLQLELPNDKEKLLKLELNEIARELAKRPRVLCHRDFHSRNLMFYEGRQYIIDHQDARMGPSTYDLASLLRDPYVELNEELIQELYNFFIDKKLSLGASAYWAEETKLEFELMTVQRIVKAIGTYAYQTAVAKNMVYQPYIPKAIDTVLAAANRLERFTNLCDVLTKYQTN